MKALHEIPSEEVYNHQPFLHCVCTPVVFDVMEEGGSMPVEVRYRHRTVNEIELMHREGLQP